MLVKSLERELELSVLHVFMYSPCFLDTGHAVEEEETPAEQSHPAPDLLTGGHCGQWQREHCHPKQNCI